MAKRKSTKKPAKNANSKKKTKRVSALEKELAKFKRENKRLRSEAKSRKTRKKKTRTNSSAPKTNVSLNELRKVLRGTKKRLSPDERKLYKQSLDELQQLIEFEQATFGFVDAEPLENLHVDGTVAVRPSIMRHDARQPKWTEMLQRAEDEGNLDEVAQAIADQGEFSVQEVYTLFYSL